MKKSLKLALATLATASMVGALAPSASAATAACAACSPWVLSPDGDSVANSVSVTDGQSLWMAGNPDSTQAQGIFGAGFTVSSDNFAMKFDSDLATWDSYNATEGYYDAFIVTVSTSGYYWDSSPSDPILADASTFVWGGNSWTDGVQEFYNTTVVGTPDMISMSGPGLFYVSLVLDTATLPNSDVIHPSSGTFHVNVIPEPETYAMLLAGLGLMGFVGRRRQRRLAAV